MSKIFLRKKYIIKICKQALNEDLYPSGDISSKLLKKNIKKKAKLISNESGIIGGLEFAIGIPGTVGGALCNNAGIADGQNFGSLVEEITVLQKTTISKISKSELQFNYRSSNIKNHTIILSAILNLQFRKKIECELEMRKLLEQRQKTQPTSSRNAGSMFKNPTNQYAGELIEKSGCKGMSIGGASVSELHANFIVHNGNATTEEIIQLMEMVSKKVFEYCGIDLEPEVEWWGEQSTSKLFK